MAVTATPLTLEKNQEISIKVGLTQCFCFNDSNLSEQHYRSIPNDGNPQWFLYWANLPSVAIGTKGEYAVAVTMWDYYPDYREVTNLLMDAQKSGFLIDVPERGRMVIAKTPFVYEENRHLVFRKIVWVRNSDLVLQSAADTQADRDAAEKKQKDDLDKLLVSPKNPITANQDPPKSSVIWIILGVLLVLIGGTWALISGAKKRRANAEAEKKTGSGSNVNIIRIPKNS